MCGKFVFLKWKTPFILEGHNFYKYKWNWMIQKLNEMPIEGVQIIIKIYHQPIDNYDVIV